MELAITDYTVTSAAGRGLGALNESIANLESGLEENDFPGCFLETWIGRVKGVESIRMPSRCEGLLSRNNQLAWLGLQEDGFLDAADRMRTSVSPTRIGVVMGTSTSSIGRTEEGYARLDDSGEMPTEYQQAEVHNLNSPGIFVARALGIEGPVMTISTACSSSAKVFATATRWIALDLVDAVLVGGVDSLCLSVLYGFNSLGLISSSKCRPMDAGRNGINIGEAAGYALVCRADAMPDARTTLAGYGESCDAYHMSHPHPEGEGAVLAMRAALSRARIDTQQIGYVNLHGTATRTNDLIETTAMRRVFENPVPASSTKGWTGHTLGAAGILEAIICLETIRTGLLPQNLNCEQPDPELAFPILTANRQARIDYALSNSFGFGGNNASLIFGFRHD